MKHRSSRLSPLLTVLAALTIVAGCSSTKLAYRYADWGIEWWVEDYLVLDSAQKAQLDRDIEALRQWHCHVELPRYTQWLSRLQDDVRSNRLTQARIDHHQAQAMSVIPPLLAQITPIATRLLASLSDEQVRYLANRMEENHREMAEEFLGSTPEETAQARTERTRERVERWLGSLNQEQERALRDWSAARGAQTEIWLEGRRKWQEALLEALDNRRRDDFPEQVAYLIGHYEEVRGDRYQAMMDESRRAMADLMVALVQQADERHLDHLALRTASLRDDFQELTCE